MNTKVENQSGTSVLDYGKYALAVLIAAAGVAVFYMMPQWSGVIRGLLVAVGFGLALVVYGLTAKGREAREFFSDSLFELRKVVWPTREESYRITGMVLVVVLLISLILSGFDFVISWLIKLLLGS
ncbi:preprotein translocase subunit SecE [Arenimonas sp.]|jgi:preprotein translocase subunit SecE|uniref:preprotein translocase subunit SecE n=1 Tax=Arenimonas sp. TaxID=1872635 RepID=UPI0037BE4ABE